MNLFNIVLAALIAFPGVQGEGDDKKKKARESYYKYEREDVNMYRDKVSFQLPEPDFQEEATVNTSEVDGESLPEPKSLSYMFTSGKKVHIEADYRLDAMVKADISIKSRIETLDGYRVQLYAGRGESGAQRVKGRFWSLFPEHVAYLTFKSPNYVVRVGDFLDKEDVTIFTRQIREHFPGAFPVPDRVKVPKLQMEEEE